MQEPQFSWHTNPLLHRAKDSGPPHPHHNHTSSPNRMSTAAEVTSPELRWRNYQQLVWSQQQIHLQIQQQQQQQQQQQEHQGSKGDGSVDGAGNHGLSHAPHQQQQSSEAVDNKSVEEKTKEIGDPWENFDAHAAFLGPTLWEKRLPYDGQDFKLEYVDLEEFLTENGIPVDENKNGGHHGPGTHAGLTNISHGFPPAGQFMAGPSRSSHPGPLQTMSHAHMKDLTLEYSSLSRSPSPSTSSSSSESRDLTPAVSPDSTQPPELGLGAVPGHEFDPRRRAFTDDELKPQPMIKKSRKQFVPDNAKDAKYWVRRRKNNMAAKRSRDARRVKENQIAMRACYLEKENQFMKQELERVQKENSLLKEQINSYSVDHQR